MKRLNLFKAMTCASLCVPFAVLTSCNKTTDAPIAILYTNDVHCGYESGLTYSSVKGYRNHLESQGYKTLLVDSGDFANGGIYGSEGKGKYPVATMNAAGYDVVACGNHEFDFGMQRFNEIKNELNCSVISSNFYHLKDGTPTTRVLDDTKVFNIGGKKIGFVGISTPDSITSSNPTSFQDEHGNFIYSFLAGTQPTAFYSAIQKSVDSLTDQQCDCVIALTHLGEHNDASDYCVKKTINNTKGINVVLDGHSHTFDPCTKVKNKNNEDVLLTQTGTGLARFGQLTIDKDKQLSLSMISTTNYHDDKVDEELLRIKKETDEKFDKKIGDIDFKLQITDDDKKRIVRKQETNLGDLIADAYHQAANDTDNPVDFAFINSGGIRADINPGEVLYRNLLQVSPFGNALCKVKVKGSVILDALEYSVCYPKAASGSPLEFGGFLQVSKGLTFSADMTKASPVETNDKGFVKVGAGARRVSNAKIGDNEIVADNDYVIASTTYVIRDGGDGYNMFKNNYTTLPCPSIIDTDVLINYFV